MKEMVWIRVKIMSCCAENNSLENHGDQKQH